RRLLFRPLRRDVDEQGLPALDVGGGLQEARNRHERHEEEQVKESRRHDGEDQGALRTIPRKPGPDPPWQALHGSNYGAPTALVQRNCAGCLGEIDLAGGDSYDPPGGIMCGAITTCTLDRLGPLSTVAVFKGPS